MENKAKKTAAVKAAALALGYWDFETIKAALEMAAAYLEKNSVDGAIASPADCREISEKINALQNAARAYYQD